MLLKNNIIYNFIYLFLNNIKKVKISYIILLIGYILQKMKFIWN